MNINISEITVQLFKNKVLIPTVSAWFIAQSLKVILGFIQEKRFNFKWFIGTGGMPSSHSAWVMALAVSVGLSVGFDSIPFGIAIAFGFVTMFDAQGSRRTIGRQAEALNKIMEDIYAKKKVKEERLKELIGHTPIQVFAGAAIGLAVAVIYYTYFN